MLRKIDLTLKSSDSLNYQMSSLFHGFLFELISSNFEYCNYLHQSKLHPYTQHLEKLNDIWHWVITFLDEDSFKYIWQENLSKCKTIYLKNKDLNIAIEGFEIAEVPISVLDEIFINGKSGFLLQIKFLTPTSFKRNGSYVIFPSLDLIYKSIMNKYDALNLNSKVFDRKTLEDLCNYSSISSYNLKSTTFSLEGLKIKSFIGSITIRFTGPKTLYNFAKMLFYFAQFSGIGIKTSIGMGAISMLDISPKSNT